MWLILPISVIAWLLWHKTTSLTQSSIYNQPLSPHSTPKDTSNTGVFNSTPPIPKLAGEPIDISFLSWYHPSDSLVPGDIASARQMTIRQIQTAYNALGTRLAVSGVWDLPTQQATWDFQYLHTNDNPENPLNITGEFDYLTQDALQTLYATKTNVQHGFY